MRVFGAVMMLAGMVWMVVGCSGGLWPLMGGDVNGAAASGLVPTDSVSQTRSNLSVADGVLTLPGMGRTRVSGTELLDGVVQVISGAADGGPRQPGDDSAER